MNITCAMGGSVSGKLASFRAKHESLRMIVQLYAFSLLQILIFEK